MRDFDRTMTANVQSTILGTTSKRVRESSVKYMTDYVRMFLAFNKVFCAKCFQEIQIGQHYQNNSKGNNRWAKYYHMDCYKRMHY